MNAIGLQVIDAVIRHYEITLGDLLWGGRRKEYARPRKMACFMLRKHARMTYQDIGSTLGLHYSTVIHHCQALEGAIDPQVVQELNDAQEYYQMIAGIEYDEKIPF